MKIILKLIRSIDCSKRIIKAFKFYFYNSFITNFPNHKVRLLYLRKILNIKIGQTTSINMGCFFAGNNIEIGNNTVVNRSTYFDGRAGKITIGNNVSISFEVCFLTMSHDVNDPFFKTFTKEILIEDYVWIGIRSIINPGVIMKKGSVLGAFAMINKPVEEYTINVGIPAKQISMRKNELEYNLNYFPYFNSDIT